jgi:transcriptional regulator with XRE-family HTH domain
MATFGENLRALRKSRGYSQEKFARIIDSNQANITAWERETRVPNLATIQHIADTFKVPLSSLISLEETGIDDDYVRKVADLLQHNPKIGRLLEKVKYLSDSDLDAVLSVVDAITRPKEL